MRKISKQAIRPGSVVSTINGSPPDSNGDISILSDVKVLSTSVSYDNGVIVEMVEITSAGNRTTAYEYSSDLLIKSTTSYGVTIETTTYEYIDGEYSGSSTEIRSI